MNIREQIRKDILKAISHWQLAISSEEIEVTRTSDSKFGDYSTNVALRLTTNDKRLTTKARKIKQSPIETARILTDKLRDLPYVEKLEVAGPGFINFFIKPEVWQKEVEEVLKKGKDFGSNDSGKDKKVQVEFISANPTGPLTLGNGRGGFTGDTIANVLEKSGYLVEREYYVNDVGIQVGEHLSNSIKGRGPYKGKYIDDLAKRMAEEEKRGDLWVGVGSRAARIILEEIIKETVKKMQINHGKGFDEYFLESSLYFKDRLALERKEKAMSKLQSDDLIYEKEGAKFFRTTRFGDDKDRVIFKKDGVPTYFFSDILHKAYIMGDRFDKLVLLLGADHHGYQARLHAAMEAFGHKGKLSIIILQLVRLISKGKEVRMSKRSGTYVTLDELIDEYKVSLDAARFFFIAYAPSTHIDFDLDLAREKSNKNPVYYVQYAYARIASILTKAEGLTTNAKQDANYQLLTTNYELDLIKQITRLPELVEDIAGNFAVHRLTVYSTELADSFHRFYENCRVIPSYAEASEGKGEEKELMQARLALISATKIAFANTLSLLGVSAPEKM